MASMNRTLVIAGVVTVFQAAGQVLFTTLGILQYFCIIDFLKELPLPIFIRILYFHSPDTCGVRINIGQAIDGMANQAFVLLTEEPFTATRTFIINALSLGLSVPWFFVSVGLMNGGAKNNLSKFIKWLWIFITVVVSGWDLVATVTYANDSFHTRTLRDIMKYIDASASGTGNIEVNTSWASWVMVIIYSRFVVLFISNLFFIVTVVIIGGAKRLVENTGVQVEAPIVMDATFNIKNMDEEIEESSLSLNCLNKRIPRPVLSPPFWRKKTRPFATIPAVLVTETSPNSMDASPETSPPPQRLNIVDKKQVNFPENLLSFPQRLENMIAEQQRRLDRTVIDTSGRLSPPRTSQSMPQLASTPNQDSRGRRGTAAELQSQLPWAYIPASTLRMRDQLPPDEDLPPVPLADYTAIPSSRKASVHRAASSLSTLTQKRQLPPLTQSDVLY